MIKSGFLIQNIIMTEIYFDAKQKARKKYGNKSTSIGNDDNKTP